MNIQALINYAFNHHLPDTLLDDMVIDCKVSEAIEGEELHGEALDNLLDTLEHEASLINNEGFSGQLPFLVDEGFYTVEELFSILERAAQQVVS